MVLGLRVSGLEVVLGCASQAFSWEQQRNCKPSSDVADLPPQSASSSSLNNGPRCWIVPVLAIIKQKHEKLYI